MPDALTRKVHNFPRRWVLAKMPLVCAILLVCINAAIGGEANSEIKIGYLRGLVPRDSLSLLDQPPSDDGIAGAKLGLADNATTGHFIGQKFSLDIATSATHDDVLAAFHALVTGGSTFIVADLPAAELLLVAAAAREKGIIVFNIGATDDRLREEDCLSNLIHVAPSRAMLADALAQYLVKKQWRQWALVHGSHENDRLFAAALKRSAERFGGEILAEKEFRDVGTARRTDTGLIKIEQQISSFTQDLPDYDVLLVADESEVFGLYVPYRTWLPRPVAGTAGLIAAAWHSASEQWGGIQMQNRFVKEAARRMRDKDMSAWVAVRIIGEAAARTHSTEPGKISDYIRSVEFSVAAFKGQKLTIRDWDLQLRQPIFIGDAKSVVSVSPQEGFLHQYSELDTLGVDKQETKCVLK